MYKKVITYTDFDGKEKTKSFYFNLTRPELLEMKRSPIYEMQDILDRINQMDDPDEELSYAEKDEMQEAMGDILRNLVVLSYGVKSEDGTRFVKRVGDRRYGVGEDFTETMAYDALYMEMIGDIGNMINFVRAIVPADIQVKMDEDPEMQELMSKTVDKVYPTEETPSDNVVSLNP